MMAQLKLLGSVPFIRKGGWCVARVKRGFKAFQNTKAVPLRRRGVFISINSFKLVIKDDMELRGHVTSVEIANQGDTFSMDR